jgi:hypothetical protein
MIHYVVTREHSYAMRPYARSWDRMRLLFYDDVFRATSLPAGAYIFTDIERLTASGRQLAIAVWQQLFAYTPHVRLLNDPARLLTRYELLCELARDGTNRYGARRATERLDGLRYPVFIRSEREHTGALTPLLHSPAAVRRALRWARLHAYRAGELLVVEFCDTSDSAGLFRKYSAFLVGDAVLPRHLFVSRRWHLKKPDHTDSNTAREVEAYLAENPHAATLRRIFSVAAIDYGRIDYSLAGADLQVWEINTNPTILRLADRLTEAFAQLDVASCSSPDAIPIHLDARLLAAAEREACVERRVFKARDLVAGVFANPITRPFRRAAQLLRGY